MNKFYGRFLLSLLLVIALLALSACGDAEHVEPLTVLQNQQIVMQLGIKGYKRLNDVKCYGAVVTRVNTGDWYDSYCAQHYGHLDFEVITSG